MFSVRFTILLLAILFIPFMLRFKFGNKFEPYPAVLLPSGANKLPVDSDEIYSLSSVVFAQSDDGSWKTVDKVRLLYPIRPNNHAYILNRGFGLESTTQPENRLFYNILTKLHILKNRDVNEYDKENTINWLKIKLNEQGFTSPVVKIVHKEEMVSKQTHEIISENIIYEKVLYLD